MDKAGFVEREKRKENEENPITATTKPTKHLGSDRNSETLPLQEKNPDLTPRCAVTKALLPNCRETERRCRDRQKHKTPTQSVQGHSTNTSPKGSDTPRLPNPALHSMDQTRSHTCSFLLTPTSRETPKPAQKFQTFLG